MFRDKWIESIFPDKSQAILHTDVNGIYTDDINNNYK